MSGAGWTPGEFPGVVLDASGAVILKVLAHDGDINRLTHLAAAAPAMARALESQEEYVAAEQALVEVESLTERIKRGREVERLFNEATRLRASALRSARGGGGGE